MLRTLPVFIYALIIFSPWLIYAQVERPDADNLFVEDDDAAKILLEKKKERILATDKITSEDLDLKAPNLEYLQNNEKVKVSDGVQLSKGSLKLRADEGVIDLKEESADLSGDVFFSWPAGFLKSEKAKVYFENETGKFTNGEMLAELSDFNVKADTIEKYTEFDYKFDNPSLSTCRCSDGSRPWEFVCDSALVREEGYGRAKHATLKFKDVPLFYTPYLVFPFKRERQSGLLVPQFSYSSRDGVGLRLPYFLDVDDSTDLIFEPFTETKTRTGLALDYNQIFSKKSNIESRFYFSDESARDGESRGTITSDLNDPTIDESRFAAYVAQQWRSGPDSPIPLSLLSDIHYVSDDLILREFDDEDLGRYNSRYATSRMVLRSSLGNLLSGELSGEYNQAIIEDDDLVFQRLPELNLVSQETFRPFGMNPYGLKFVVGHEFSGTDFKRDRGFDGKRYNFNPSVTVPFHYKNYFNSELRFETVHTQYDMDNIIDPRVAGRTITDEHRDLYKFTYKMGTELEKVYDLADDSLMTWLTSIGRKNQHQSLKRLKHTIEPTMTFAYTPNEEQDDLPLFDSLDRMRQQRLFNYGFTSSLYGRFIPDRPATGGILELSPEVDELPRVNSLTLLSDPGYPATNANLLVDPRINKGEIRQLATFRMYQSFDYLEEKKDLTERSPWSDVTMDVAVFPSNYFAFQFDSNVDVEEQDLSSWGISTHFKDDRGDVLRTRYSYVENSISQLEGSLEIAITDRLKLGYYTRFDERDSEFIDNQFAFRLTSSCNCWDLDLGYRERLNPDEQDFIATLTLKGLGALAQDVSMLEDQNKQR